MFTTILWATDGTAEADHALDQALELLAPGGRLVAFHADRRYVGSRVAGLPVRPDEAELKAHIEAQVIGLVAQGVEAELFVEKTGRGAAVSITDAAIDLGADAIVCGTRALHGVHGLLDASVAARVLQSATVPVIVVPPARAGVAV